MILGFFIGVVYLGKPAGNYSLFAKEVLRFPVTGKNLRSPSIYVDTNQGCVNPSFVAYAYLDFSNPHDWMGDDKNMHESVGGVVLPWPCDIMRPWKSLMRMVKQNGCGIHDVVDFLDNLW